MLAPKTDGRRVPRVDLDWETRKVLSEQTSTIDGIAGWHFPDRNDLMSLTRWASLLSASSSSLRNSRSMSAWASRVTSYIIRAAFLWMTSSLIRCVLAAEEKTEEQYSMCDLIRAVYNNFNRSLGRYDGVALANIPRSPWHLLTTLSICGPKVRCWSKVTPSSLTVFSGLMMQLSSVRWKSSGMSVQCASPRRGGELVGVCGVFASCVGWRKGWVGVSSLSGISKRAPSRRGLLSG